MRNHLIFGLLLLATAPLACEAQSVATITQLQKTMALTPDPQHGEHLYNQYCSPCHQPSAWGSAPRKIPTLAGQQSLYLLEQLIQFAVRDRMNTMMHRVVSNPEIDPQAMRDVSAFVAARPPNPNPDTGPGAKLDVGQRVYVQACATCHGKDGAGSQEDLIPAIGGQRYSYLLVRLGEFSQQHTTYLEPAVANILGALSPREIHAVAAYTASLPALRAK
jgi:cytochrome c553